MSINNSYRLKLYFWHQACSNNTRLSSQTGCRGSTRSIVKKEKSDKIKKNQKKRKGKIT